MKNVNIKNNRQLGWGHKCCAPSLPHLSLLGASAAGGAHHFIARVLSYLPPPTWCATMVNKLPVSHNDCAPLGVVGGVSRPTEAEVALAEPDRRVQLLAYLSDG